LQGSYNVLRRCIECIEANERLQVTTLCEPKLDKRGLYPTLSTKQSSQQVRDMMNLLVYADGSHTLLEIAEKTEVPMWKLVPLVKTLKRAKLLVGLD
jgi:aminopeptidase-like protein